MMVLCDGLVVPMSVIERVAVEKLIRRKLAEKTLL
jgi:hypothetical protein